MTRNYFSLHTLKTKYKEEPNYKVNPSDILAGFYLSG